MKLTVKLKKNGDWMVTGFGRVNEYVDHSSRGVPPRKRILDAVIDALDISVIEPPVSKTKSVPKKTRRKDLTDAEIWSAVYGSRKHDEVKKKMTSSRRPFEQIDDDCAAAVKRGDLSPQDESLAIGALLRIISE